MPQKRRALLALFPFLLALHSFAQPVAIHGALSVSGNKIVNKNGLPVSFAGNSLFWSNDGWGGEKYYNANVVAWLRSDWNSAIVRAAMGVQDNGGYLADKEGNKSKVKTVVDAAITNGMYVIIDWHSHKAEDNTQDAIDFFKEMAQTYGDKPNVIYEVYNEPINSSWSGDIKPYAEKVIGAIRSIDPDNLVIVGTRFYSAMVNEPADDPIQGKNIAYTIHFYAASHRQDYRDRCSYALGKGIALFATEWGTVSADGSGNVDESETYAWMDFLKKNNISHCNWSINDKPEGASALNQGASSSGNWSDANLTWSGSVVRGILRGYDYGKITEGVGFSQAPIITGAKQSYSFKVDYTATQNRELIVSMLDKQGTVLGSTTVQVTGFGTKELSLALDNMPVVASDYRYMCELRPVGGNSGSNLDKKTIGDVAVLENEPLYVVEAESYAAMSGVQTEPCAEGGQDVGYLDQGDWLSYANITISQAGPYTVYYRVSSATDGGVISLEKDEGKTILGTVEVPNTGDWQAWSTISQQVNLPAGSYSLGIGIPGGGYNLNLFAIVPPPSNVDGLEDLKLEANTGLEVYPVPAHDFIQVSKASDKSILSILSLTGALLISSQSDRIDVSTLPKGVYFVQNGNLSGRFIKE